MMKRTILTVILTFFLTLTSTLTYADVIGKITAIEGNVDILRRGQERAAPVMRVEEPVSEGDIVRTKSNGKAEITFTDNSVVRLAPGTRLQITEYLMEGNKRKSGVMNLFRGKIRAVVSKSRGFLSAAFGGGDRFEVRTPTAVAGVKGTNFFVSYIMGVTGIVVTDGKVDVFNPAIPGQIVRVTEGNGTFIAENKPPSPPRPANDVEIIRHTKDTDTSEKPKEKKGDETITNQTTADAGGDVFGFSAPDEGTPPPTTTDTGDLQPPVLPSSETHPELLAPIITFAATPASITNLSTAVFAVTATDSATFTYTMDNWSATSSMTTSDTVTITGLSEGTHTITVIAANIVGNKSQPITYTWTTDYTAPTAGIASSPPALANSSSAAFGFTANEAVSSYSYSLDGGITWVSTGPSLNLTGISEGGHAIQVRATDLAGNTSVASSPYSWTTDYTAAVLAFTSFPSAITNANIATFATSSSETVTYSYTLDGAPVGTTSLTGLPEGPHIFTVTATDPAGNTSTTTYSWITDYTTPTVSIASRQASPETGATAAVNVNFASNETSAFSYQLDGGPLTSTGSVLSLTGVAEGIHTISYTAIDAAGNPSALGSLSFDLSRYSLIGNFWGCIGNVTGTAAGEVAGIWGQTWGGWIINMNGTGAFVPNATWTLYAGGTSSDATYTDARNNGYWLLIAPGSTDFTLQTLSGTSTFKYLSRDRLGAGTGTLTGTYDGLGNYSLTDTGAGTYTETPLAWSGNIAPDLNSAGLYSMDTAFGPWLDIEGSSTGIMGGVTPPWAGPSAVNYMGTYDVSLGIGVGPPYLWTPEISSFNFNDSTNTTFDGGAYKGFIGGVWRWDRDANGDGFIDFGTIDARVYSLYIDPLGNAGILKGSLTGEHHPELTNFVYSGIFAADGTWTPIQMIPGIGILPVNLFAQTNIVSSQYAYNITSSSLGPILNKAYVTNQGSNTVSVIDTTTNTVIATIGVGSAPGRVAVNPQTNRAYVTNEGNGTISVIDTTNNTVIATIAVGTNPLGVAVNPQTNRAYVTNYTSNTVSVIDTTTNTVIATIGVGSVTKGVDVNPQTNRAYVTNQGSNTVSVIDATTNTIIATIGVGSAPMGVDVNPQTNRAYVTNYNSNTVSVIDTTTNTVIATIGVGTNPNSVDVNPQTNRAYVTNQIGNTVSVIDTTTNTVIATITVGSNPWDVDVNPQTSRAYVANYNSNTVSVIDTTTNAVIANIAVGVNPYGVDAYTLYTLYPYGTFNSLGSITVLGDEMLTADTWRYNINGQNWGILKSIIGGDYIGPTSDTACAIAGSCDTWSLSTTVTLPTTIYGTKTDGSLWSNGILAGQTYGYGADTTTTPNTWISVGETIGTFDPVNLVWQAVQTGVWLDTIKFLTMAGKIGTTPDTATLAALNIPFAEVGRTNLSGSGTMGGGPINVNMNNVIFFASQIDPSPKIWATGDVNGNYGCSACGTTAVALTGPDGLSANFNVQTFDTFGQKWTATVNGSGTYTGTGTMNGTNVVMEGAAAGTNTGIGPGTFSGTGAGVVK